jgi:hypothetical protein
MRERELDPMEPTSAHNSVVASSKEVYCIVARPALLCLSWTEYYCSGQQYNFVP